MRNSLSFSYAAQNFYLPPNTSFKVTGVGAQADVFFFLFKYKHLLCVLDLPENGGMIKKKKTLKDKMLHLGLSPGPCIF